MPGEQGMAADDDLDTLGPMIKKLLFTGVLP